MEADHENLFAIAGRVKEARDVPGLVAALGDLSAFLAEHFEREERDQGIFGILADRGVSEQVDELIGEHRQILHDVKDLASVARRGEMATQLGERAADLAKQLRDHEAREQALAERALGAAASA
jgi:hypothetical protein